MYRVLLTVVLVDYLTSLNPGTMGLNTTLQSAMLNRCSTS